jgi:excisionase family DNA binding protein
MTESSENAVAASPIGPLDDRSPAPLRAESLAVPPIRSSTDEGTVAVPALTSGAHGHSAAVEVSDPRHAVVAAPSPHSFFQRNSELTLDEALRVFGAETTYVPWERAEWAICCGEETLARRVAERRLSVVTYRCASPSCPGHRLVPYRLAAGESDDDPFRSSFACPGCGAAWTSNHPGDPRADVGVDEAAERIGVSPRTVARWISQGRMAWKVSARDRRCVPAWAFDHAHKTVGPAFRFECVRGGPRSGSGRTGAEARLTRDQCGVLRIRPES